MASFTAWDLVACAVIVAGTAAVLRRGVPKAYGLSFVMLVVFAVDFAGNVWGHTSVASDLAYQASDVEHGQRLWSIVTSMFVHAGLAHIFGNLFILVTAGPALEDRVGERKFLVIYFLSGLAAVAAHTILTFVIPRVVAPDSLALGASGAIFGALTAFAVRYPRERLPLILVWIVLWMPAFGVLLVYLGFNLVYMFSNTGIAWWGHFAGFLVGLAFAYTLPHPATTRGSAAAPGKPSARGLPDADKLAPFAVTPDTRRILERIRQFTPETRTSDDVTYANAWLDQFFQKATCPSGHAFTRDGLTATCEGGETTVDFRRG